jgi:hypothetical protein
MSEIYTPETPDIPDMPSSSSVSGDPSKDWMAIVALVAGILSLCGWLFPLCGFPLSIIAVVFGILGMKSTKRTLAIVGLAMGGLSFLLSLVNAVAGALIGLSNPDMFQDLLDSVDY